MNIPKDIPWEVIDAVRDEFEKLLPDHMDITLLPDGNYAHKTTRIMWQGFALYFFRGHTLERQERGVNFMVIGRCDTHLTTSPFPPRPHRFYRMKEASEELVSLANRNRGQTFALYRPVLRLKLSRQINESVYGKKRVWPYKPSFYYQYQGLGSSSDLRDRVFLTDDYGNAVNPGHIAPFEYIKG